MLNLLYTGQVKSIIVIECELAGRGTTRIGAFDATLFNIHIDLDACVPDHEELEVSTQHTQIC